MLYYKDNQYYISGLRVKYIQDKIELENIVGQEGKQWWLDFETKWDSMEILEFVDILVTIEQLARLEEVNELNIKEGHSGVLADYVIRNTFPVEVNHVLKDLQNRKETKALREENMNIMIATTEMYESQYNENLNLMLAITELYEMKMGV